MKEISEIIDWIESCQSMANLSNTPYSLCVVDGELLVTQKRDAWSMGYHVIETCNPVDNNGFSR